MGTSPYPFDYIAVGPHGVYAICPVCGETAPEPATLCLARIAGTAEHDAPCDYSREGEARTAETMADAQTAAFDARMQGRPSPSRDGGER